MYLLCYKSLEALLLAFYHIANPSLGHLDLKDLVYNRDRESLTIPDLSMCQLRRCTYRDKQLIENNSVGLE